MALSEAHFAVGHLHHRAREASLRPPGGSPHPRPNTAKGCVLAGFEELLAPPVVQVRGQTIAATQLRPPVDLSHNLLAARSLAHRILLSVGPGVCLGPAASHREGQQGTRRVRQQRCAGRAARVAAGAEPGGRAAAAAGRPPRARTGSAAHRTDGLRRLRSLADRAGVAAFSPHDCRRSLAGDLLDAGVDLATVLAMLGHASPATTARYDRRGERAVRQASERVHVPYTGTR